MLLGVGNLEQHLLRLHLAILRYEGPPLLVNAALAIAHDRSFVDKSDGSAFAGVADPLGFEFGGKWLVRNRRNDDAFENFTHASILGGWRCGLLSRRLS